MRLTPEEGRVIGSLIEKQLTTPQQYPLTLNSLVLACNQSSNRDPVVSYDEQLVQTTLVSLRSAELIGLIYPSHGRSVTRYRHLLAERLGLDEREMALMAALLLRGAQTAGELRARSERMAQFDGIGAVDTDLVRLSEKEEALVVRLPRRPGQKEERWAELLTGAGSRSGPAATPVGSGAPAWAESEGRAWAGSEVPAGSGLSVQTGLSAPPAPIAAPAASAPPAPIAAPAPSALPAPIAPPPPPAAVAPPAASAPSAPSLVAGASGSPPGSGPLASVPAPPGPDSFEAVVDCGENQLLLASLVEEVASLRAEVATLRADFDQLRDQLGG